MSTPYDRDTHIALHRIWCAALHGQVDADFDAASSTREAMAFGDLKAYATQHDVPLNPHTSGTDSFGERLAKAVWE